MNSLKNKCLFAIKDLNLNICACNKKFLTYTGYKKETHIIGKNDAELSWNTYAELYRSHEIDVLNHNVYPVIQLGIDKNNREFVALCNKYPHHDKKGNLRGLICYAREIYDHDVLQLNHIILKCNKRFLSANQTNYIALAKEHSHIKLSQREKQCLFYLLHGKTYKTIANIFYISPRTVESHARNLMLKFGCNTKAMLIEAAINEGFGNVIPYFNSISEIIEVLKES